MNRYKRREIPDIFRGNIPKSGEDIEVVGIGRGIVVVPDKTSIKSELVDYGNIKGVIRGDELIITSGQLPQSTGKYKHCFSGFIEYYKEDEIDVGVKETYLLQIRGDFSSRIVERDKVSMLKCSGELNIPVIVQGILYPTYISGGEKEPILKVHNVALGPYKSQDFESNI